MTPESKQIADVVDAFDDAERACMRDAVLEIAGLCRAARSAGPVQLGFRYSEPGSNLILGPWCRPSPAQKRKPPKKARRLEIVKPAESEPSPGA